MPYISSAPESILVLGAGELGMAVLRGLAQQRGSAVGPTLSVLVRPPPPGEPDGAWNRRADGLAALGVEVVQADIAADSREALAKLFRGFCTIISCTGFVAGLGTQRKITAAILDAGTFRYVPWQFGVDYDAIGRGSGQDVWDEQLDVRDMLRAQDRTAWTIVSTGIFTSFLFDPGFGVVDLAQPRVAALGSWDNRVTATTSEDIGRLTAAILAAEPRIDGVAFVAGDTLSYAELAEAVERHQGRKVERILWTVPELARDAAAHPSDEFRKYRLAFARDNGVAFDKAGTFNALRGIDLTDVPGWLTAQSAA